MEWREVSLLLLIMLILLIPSFAISGSVYYHNDLTTSVQDAVYRAPFVCQVPAWNWWWTPYFHGASVYETGYSLIAILLNWIFGTVVFDTLIRSYVAIEVIIAGISAFCLSSILFKNRIGRFLGSLLYAFSPFFLMWLNAHPIEAWSYALQPLLYYYAIKVAKEVNTFSFSKLLSRNLPFGAALFAFALIFPNPEAVYYSGMPFLIFVFLLVLVERGSFSKIILTLVATIGAGILLSFWFLFPAWISNETIFVNPIAMASTHSLGVLRSMSYPDLITAFQGLNWEMMVHFSAVLKNFSYPLIGPTFIFPVILGAAMLLPFGKKPYEKLIIVAGICAVFLAAFPEAVNSLRQFLPYGELFRKPYLFNLTYVLAVSISASAIIQTASHIDMKKIVSRLLYRKVLRMCCVAVILITLLSTVILAYIPPFSPFSNDNSLFKGLSSKEVFDIQNNLYKLDPMKQYYGLDFTTHAIVLGHYPMVPLSREFFNYFSSSPAYATILGAYGVRFITAYNRIAGLPYIESGDVIISMNPQAVPRFHLTNGVWVAGGPNALSAFYTLKNSTSFSLAFADDQLLSGSQTGTFSAMMFYNFGITDYVISSFLKKYMVPIPSTQEYGATNLYPSYMGASAPGNMARSIYGQRLISDDALQIPANSTLKLNVDVPSDQMSLVMLRVSPNFDRGTDIHQIIEISLANGNSTLYANAFCLNGLGFRWISIPITIPSGSYLLKFSSNNSFVFDSSFVIPKAMLDAKVLQFKSSLTKSNIPIIYAIEPSSYASSLTSLKVLKTNQIIDLENRSKWSLSGENKLEFFEGNLLWNTTSGPLGYIQYNDGFPLNLSGSNAISMKFQNQGSPNTLVLYLYSQGSYQLYKIPLTDATEHSVILPLGNYQDESIGGANLSSVDRLVLTCESGKGEISINEMSFVNADGLYMLSHSYPYSSDQTTGYLQTYSPIVLNYSIYVPQTSSFTFDAIINGTGTLDVRVDQNAVKGLTTTEGSRWNRLQSTVNLTEGDHEVSISVNGTLGIDELFLAEANFGKALNDFGEINATFDPGAQAWSINADHLATSFAVLEEPFVVPDPVWLMRSNSGNVTYPVVFLSSFYGFPINNGQSIISVSYNAAPSVRIAQIISIITFFFLVTVTFVSLYKKHNK